jgi:hypothetical protein
MGVRGGQSSTRGFFPFLACVPNLLGCRSAQEKKALRRILMEKKAHLTSEGLENICLIKAGMNRGRVEFSQSDLGRRRRLRVAALRIN